MGAKLLIGGKVAAWFAFPILMGLGYLAAKKVVPAVRDYRDRQFVRRQENLLRAGVR